MKTIKHTIGDQERTLEFGLFYFSKYVGDYMGKDPLTLTEGLTPSQQFDYICAIVYGGVNTYNKVNKLPLVSKEDVQDWIGSMTDSDVAAFLNKYTELQKVEPGEAIQVESPSPGTN